jgi:hypothetical protein
MEKGHKRISGGGSRALYLDMNISHKKNMHLSTLIKCILKMCAFHCT